MVFSRALSTAAAVPDPPSPVHSQPGHGPAERALSLAHSQLLIARRFLFRGQEFAQFITRLDQ